jgi:hypothetical protein
MPPTFMQLQLISVSDKCDTFNSYKVVQSQIQTMKLTKFKFEMIRLIDNPQLLNHLLTEFLLVAHNYGISSILSGGGLRFFFNLE